MIGDDVIIWVVIVLLSIFFTQEAFDHYPFGTGVEIGYASILSWIRATIFMFLSSISWMLLGLMTGTFNNCSDAFSACFTSPTYATVTASELTNTLTYWLPYLFYGFAAIFFVIGWVITVYMVLPVDKLPKPFRYFGKQIQLEGGK